MTDASVDGVNQIQCSWSIGKVLLQVPAIDAKFLPILQQQLDSKIFGVNLEDLSKREQNFIDGVPTPVYQSVEYLLTDSTSSISFWKKSELSIWTEADKEQIEEKKKAYLEEKALQRTLKI